MPPVGHGADDGLDGLTIWGKFVFYGDGLCGKDRAGDELVCLQVMELFGEHLGGNPVYFSFKLPEAFLAEAQRADDADLPFAAEDVHGIADGAVVGGAGDRAVRCFFCLVHIV